MTYEAAGEPLHGPKTIDLFSQFDAVLLFECLDVYRSSYLREPELALMAAVLEDAINCYVTYLPAKRLRERRIFDEAEEWFFNGSDDGLFSFDSVCGYLRIDPGYVRRGLLQYKQRHMGKDSWFDRAMNQRLSRERKSFSVSKSVARDAKGPSGKRAA